MKFNILFPKSFFNKERLEQHLSFSDDELIINELNPKTLSRRSKIAFKVIKSLLDRSSRGSNIGAYYTSLTGGINPSTFYKSFSEEMNLVEHYNNHFSPSMHFKISPAINFCYINKIFGLDSIYEVYTDFEDPIVNVLKQVELDFLDNRIELALITSVFDFDNNYLLKKMEKKSQQMKLTEIGISMLIDYQDCIKLLESLRSFKVKEENQGHFFGNSNTMYKILEHWRTTYEKK
jgi:hypothetical protein